MSVLSRSASSPALGEWMALRGRSGLDVSATVAEVAGDVVRVIAPPLGGEGTAVDAAWIACERLLQAPSVVLDQHLGGAWLGIGAATVVAGRWLRRSAPVGLTAMLHLGGAASPPRVVRSATVCDIGIGGLGIVVHDAVGAGERGVVELLDELGRPLGELAFVVVHAVATARGTRVGCRFLSLLDGARVEHAAYSGRAHRAELADRDAGLPFHPVL